VRGALNIEHPAELINYLRESGHVAPNEALSIQVLSGGVSNRTVRIERENGEAWVLKQALAQLRVPTPWLSSPERVHREALGLRWLSRLLPAGAVPEFVFEDHEKHLLAMRAVPSPHSNWKVLLLSGQIDDEYVIEFGANLRAIHDRSREHQEEIEPLFSDKTFFESLRLEPYYVYTAGQVAGAARFLHELIEETRANVTALVHGDYSPKNILVRKGHLVLLDYEVIHWGDPAFDLGFSLTHLLSKAHWMAHIRSRFQRAAELYWNSYGKADFESRAARHTLACLLARVAGRSPLEYLDATARKRQTAAVLGLIQDAPTQILEVIHRFCGSLDN
jgi:aminoglycoside phosphotransferase (APT) family kinase protein